MDRIKTILPSVLRGLENPDKQTRSKLVAEWPSIIGAKLAPHTKPQLSQRGVLYVHTDESVLAFEINQKYRQALLKRAQAALGEDKVKDVRVLVGK